MKLKKLLLLGAIWIAGCVFAGTGTDISAGIRSCFGIGTASGQSISLKTNALYWATATPNLAAEFALSPRLTLEIGGGYNPFGTKIATGGGAETLVTGTETPNIEKSSRHWLVQPELRWWFTRTFAGTFVGVHLHAGGFDVGGISPLTALKNNRYDGWMVGAGIGVGHHWLLGARWGIEAQAGFGFAQMEYDKYDLSESQNQTANRFKNTYIGSTRLNFSLVYYLR